MASFDVVAKQFVEFYYNTFDKDRKELGPLYRAQSMLTFESTAVQGTEPIVAKLSELPFKTVKHAVSTLDAQPMEDGKIIILVTGALLVDEEARPMNYAQVFSLAPDGMGSYYIYNDVFKLVYG